MASRRKRIKKSSPLTRGKRYVKGQGTTKSINEIYKFLGGKQK